MLEDGRTITMSHSDYLSFCSACSDPFASRTKAKKLLAELAEQANGSFD